MKDIMIGIAIGWFLGGSAIWAYFAWANLLRTREEYLAAKNKEAIR